VFATVQATLARHSMTPVGVRLVAAVSAGADSVALAYILTELGLLAAIAHVNHQLRGSVSDADAEFVRALAHRLDVPFYLEIGPVPAGNIEQGARRIRRRFFQSLVSPTQRVATAHTLDDQAETVLFRILRGSGLAGLRGILPVTDEGIVRPLLHVSRSALRTYLAERAIDWREDASNVSLRFARNRIRHQLLPTLGADWNPQLPQALAQLADVAYEEERAHPPPDFKLDAQGRLELDVRQLQPLARGTLRRNLRDAMRGVKGNLRGIEFAHIERAVELALSPRNSGRAAFAGIEVVRSFDGLLLRCPGPLLAVGRMEVEVGKSNVWPPTGPVSRIRISAPGTYDTLKASPAWELRGWQPGDQYQPIGHHSPVKLQDLFQKARVPSWKRRVWPILIRRDGEAEQILWAQAFGPVTGGPLVEVDEYPAIG
jgi:tRNA(Ile)-lysidine synthase